MTIHILPLYIQKLRRKKRKGTERGRNLNNTKWQCEKDMSNCNVFQLFMKNFLLSSFTHLHVNKAKRKNCEVERKINLVDFSLRLLCWIIGGKLSWYIVCNTDGWQQNILWRNFLFFFEDVFAVCLPVKACHLLAIPQN